MELLCKVIEKDSRQFRNVPMTPPPPLSLADTDTVCSLAMSNSISERALAFVTLFGGVIWKGGHVYCVYQNERRFNSWLTPARAAIAFCLHQGISLDTPEVTDALDTN